MVRGKVANLSSPEGRFVEDENGWYVYIYEYIVSSKVVDRKRCRDCVVASKDRNHKDMLMSNTKEKVVGRWPFIPLCATRCILCLMHYPPMVESFSFETLNETPFCSKLLQFLS